MIDLKKIYCSVILQESKSSHLKHLFEEGTMTFDDMRNIFKQVFQGKVYVSDKINKIPLSITYKDGNFAVSNSEDTLSKPFSADDVCSKCKCKATYKDSVSAAVKDLVDCLSKMDQAQLNSTFANGQNFYCFDVVLPPEDQLQNYGNRCFLQYNKLNSYDNTFTELTEDDDNTSKICEFLAKDKKLKSNCEISEDNVRRLKSSYSPDKALKEVLIDLEQIVDGIGYKAKVTDYITERYAKCIVNYALKHGIDLYRNSDFVNELIARCSYIFGRKPNIGDLFAYAKRDGIDIKNPALKELITYFDENSEQINQQIIKPVEKLVIKAGILLMKCFLGIVAVGQSRQTPKFVSEIESTISQMSEDSELTPEKIKTFRKCMKALDTYQANMPKDGILAMHNGKTIKICGRFGAISSIMKLMNY